MCTSESEAEISLSHSITTTPITRKRSSGRAISSYSDVLEHLMDGEEDNEEDQVGEVIGSEDSDEDFVVTKKKKVSGGAKRKKTSNSSLIKSINSSKSITKTSTVTSSPSPSISNPPMVILKSEARDIKIDVFIDNKEQTDVIAIKQSSDINDNIFIERPVVIATPVKIKSRSFDQEQDAFMTPSAIPMEDVKMNYDSSSSSLSIPSSNNQLVSPSPFSIQKDVTTSQIQQITSDHQYQANVGTRPVTNRGRAMNTRPTPHMRPTGKGSQVMQGSRPPIRPGTPMLRPVVPRQMMRSLRPPGPVRNSGGLLCRPRVPGPRLPGCGFNLPGARPTHPYRQRSLSTPQYSSQFFPPVVELDVSSPRPDQVFAPSPPSSVVSKLTSLGVSVAREKIPPTKHGWVLPPGISITKTNSNTAADIFLSLPNLAQALIQLGEVDGRKKLVQYHLTDAQIRALNVMGIKEDGAYPVN